MSLLSKLFGKADPPTKGAQLDPVVRAIFAKIERLLQDDAAQLELVDPKLREIFTRAPYYDKNPNGTGPFGFCKTNPIPTNGPIGELAYLSKLLTNGGERLLFHRLGAVDNIDVFEAVTFSGGQWFILFLDMYHPKKSRIAPDGFRLSPMACQFSGFNQLCADFPYDFVEMKQDKGLAPAYMPTSNILPGIKSRVYERPMDHVERLEHLGVVKNRSTPVEDTMPTVPRDYQSFLEQAVSALTTNTSVSREALYNNARAALLSQMRERTPRPSDSEIQREQRALAAAIHRVEDNYSGDPPPASKIEGGQPTEFKADFAVKLNEAAMKMVAALNTQLDYLMFFEGKSKNNFLKDAYFQRYAFGMFDAVTTMFGLELRRKLGMQLIALNYVKYLMLEFELKQADALDMVRKVRVFYNTENGQRDSAILDGGTDGASVLQGGANSPQKLTKHFSAYTDYDAPVTRVEAAKYIEQLPRFQEFCSRDRWSENAIRDAEKTAKAMMKNEIAV